MLGRGMVGGGELVVEREAHETILLSRRTSHETVHATVKLNFQLAQMRFEYGPIILGVFESCHVKDCFGQ